MTLNFENRFLSCPHLMEHGDLHDGEQYIFDTRDDYLLSVVRHSYSYGHEKGLYEMAKLSGGNVISEPIGWLSVDEVLEKVEDENRYGHLETKKP